MDLIEGKIDSHMRVRWQHLTIDSGSSEVRIFVLTLSTWRPPRGQLLETDLSGNSGKQNASLSLMAIVYNLARVIDLLAVLHILSLCSVKFQKLLERAELASEYR